MDLADQLVKQLGQMKGAAMKIGQVLSTVDFELIPEGEREEFKQRLAALRDNAPQVAFKDMRKVAEQDLGGKLGDVFEEFDEEPVAAASIGQVYRARTHAGKDVAVKVQYPGVAEAVETDMRNMQMLVPFLKRMAPGMDAKALLAELRERISEELDYEIEAANQRQVTRAYRGHPFVRIPAVDLELSTRRVLVDGVRRGHGVRGDPQAAAGRSRPLRRDRLPLLLRAARARAHRRRRPASRATTCCAPTARSASWTSASCAASTADYLAGEQALARAVIAGDADSVHHWMAELGFLPDPADFDPERILGQLQAAGEWYFTTGFRRLDPEFVRVTMESGSSPRSQYFDYMRKQTLPPQALLIRRMEGLLFAVLGELRAGADWGGAGARVHRRRAAVDASSASSRTRTSPRAPRSLAPRGADRRLRRRPVSDAARGSWRPRPPSTGSTSSRPPSAARSA